MNVVHMLSKTERKYLQGNADSISGNHRRFIKFKIKNKLRDFYMLELPLIQSAGVSEFNNIIMEFNNVKLENCKLRTGFDPATFTLPR